VIARAPFGRTGHQSSRVLFGAAALGTMSQERADPLLEILDRYGVNHLDTAADYGESELRLAPWLARRRADFFVATKTHERTGDGARASLERSLVRLGTDQVDLIQLHNLVEPDEWETAHGPGGAIEALVRARDEGLCRFIGVTGHGLRIPGMHRRSLERFDFDSVLLPLNWVLWSNPTYRADVEAVLEVAAERQVAVQTIKSMARRRWPAPERRPPAWHDRPELAGAKRVAKSLRSAAGRDPVPAARPPRHSWYQPIDDPAVADRSVRWVLAQPSVFLNTSSDAALLEATLASAQSAPDQPVPTATELDADLVDQDIRALFDGAELDRI
jgi:aryl-alcohol dehydrogenase-like predicted oxidoreductase